MCTICKILHYICIDENTQVRLKTMRYTKENFYAEHQKTAVPDAFFTSAFCLTNRNWRKNDYILFLLQYIGNSGYL